MLPWLLHAQGNRPLASVPFTADGAQLLIGAQIAGHPDTLHFLFDTGAEISVLSLRRAKAYHLNEKQEAGISGFGKEMTHVPVVEAPFLQIGAVKVPYPRFYLEDLSASEVKGISVDGIIGYDLLKRYIVKIDRDKSRLEIYKAGSFSCPPGGTRLKFSFNYDTPVVVGTLTLADGTPLTGSYHITTGGGYGLLLNFPYVQKHRLNARIPPTGSRTVQDLLKPITYTYGQAASFRIARYTLKQVTVSYSPDVNDGSAEGEIAGAIGYGIWQYFNLIFNYPEKELCLVPGKRYPP
jgi:hypothetical protein